MPKITIGIPVFNEELYISKTISSAISQFKSYDDLEIIVSDNASTDKSLIEISNTIENSDHRKKIKLIRQKTNVGAAKNFWELFESTDSQYFMWLGAHDLLSEKFISNGIDFLSRTSDYSLFSGTHLSISTDNIVEDKPIIYDFSHENKYERYLLSILKLSNCYIFHSIFDRKHLMDYTRYNCPSEDHIIISRLLWFGKLYQSKECAYARRYFADENRSMKENQGSYVNSKNNVEFYDSYLSDLNLLLSDIPGNLKISMLNKASEILFKRIGLPFLK
jgi:protein O-GlcNAc transferase